ncbi:MAG: ureidoglycolate lyase, partial [Alphaproteobacteria bacterium]
MSRDILIEPLTAEAFAPFGNVIAAVGKSTMMINRGMCGRHHDLAQLDFAGPDGAGPGGRAGISLFTGTPYKLPLILEMVERHPLGSQAFLPMSQNPFLVIVAPDETGIPGLPKAFLTEPGQGVNYHRNVWHGVLTPLDYPTTFAVVDRIGNGENLEEYWFETPHTVR